jgi:hypothetical protein
MISLRGVFLSACRLVPSVAVEYQAAKDKSG